MITPTEIKFLLIAIIFGIGNWFIMAGARDWFVENFPNVSTVLVGLVMIFILLALYKYRGLLNLK